MYLIADWFVGSFGVFSPLNQYFALPPLSYKTPIGFLQKSDKNFIKLQKQYNAKH